MLFTLVDNETRFKSKPVIDTVVYRGSDVATAWFYTKLVSVFGLGLAGIAVVGAMVAAAWVVTAVYLGMMFDQMDTSEAESGNTE
jgi:AAA family ATP:ADP antiporter